MKWKLSLILLLVLLAGPLFAAGPADGVYKFEEVNKPNQAWVYRLEMQGDVATVTVNGFQTMLHLQCRAQRNNASVAIVLKSQASSDVGAKYKPGSTLLVLTQDGSGKLLTQWKAMQPQLPASAKQVVCFQAVKD